MPCNRSERACQGVLLRVGYDDSGCGVGEAPVVSGLHTQKCPVQGIASNRTIIHPTEVIGRMGRGENPRQGVFPWFWPIGNTLR